MKILVADDDRVVRFVVGQMLGRLGHDVTVAEDGFVAKQLFETDPRAYELVIIDLTMPGMNGTELIGAMHGLNPEQRILVTTGHSESEHVAAIQGSSNVDLLIKPFQFEDLQAWIERSMPQQQASPAA